MIRRLLMLLLLPIMLPALSVAAQQAQPVATAPLSRAFALADLGYGEASLQLPRDRARYEFVLPATWKLLPTSRIEIKAQALIPDIAVVISLDGKLLKSVRPQAAGPLPLTVNLSPDLLDPTTRLHAIEIRVGKPVPCDQPYPVALVIDSASVLTFDYAQQAAPNDLSLFPFPLVQNSFTSDVVTVVLPDKPTPTETQAAVAFGAKIGARSLGRVQIQTVSASSMTPEGLKASHLVLIGAPDRNPLLSQLTLPITLTQTAGKWSFKASDYTVGAGDGILQMVTSPWNNVYNVLVISGLDEAAVVKAVRSLDSHSLLPLAGPAVAVSAFREQEQPTGPTDSRSLADLGYDDRTLSGIDKDRVVYKFRLPADWQLTEDAALLVHFARANTGDTVGNVLNVLLNEQPIFSANMDGEKIVSDTLRVPLRPSLARPGENNLTIQAVAQSLGQCIDRSLLATWTTIFSDTTLKLNHTIRAADASLSSYPAPFSSGPGLRDTLFVLAAQPTTSEISGVVRLATAWGGESAGTDFWPEVRFGDVSESQLTGFNVIAIGRPTANPLIQKINDRLPQPFIKGSDIPDQEQSAVELRTPGQVNLGWIQSLPAPWSPKRPLLVLTATTDEALALTVDAATRPREVRDAGSLLVRVQALGGAVKLTGLQSPVVAANAAAAAAAVVPPTPVPTAPAASAATSASEIPASDSSSRSLRNASLGFIVTGILIVVLAASFTVSYWRRRRAAS